MAEGRRREDEEEELRERRELGGQRRARGRALSGHSAAGERRGRGKRGGGDPEQRALGPLGSAPHNGCSFTRQDGTGFNSRRPDSGRVAFPSPSTLSGRARGNSDPSLTARGRAAETPNFPCTLNPGAAGWGLVA